MSWDAQFTPKLACMLSSSLTTTMVNGEDQCEIMGLHKISHFIKKPCNGVKLIAETLLKECIKLLKHCYTMPKQSEKSNIWIYIKL